ncbi:hypothetical protein [Virgibacillus profundi]|nr:hypothetical protein [Virgibacillus profundi]
MIEWIIDMLLDGIRDEVGEWSDIDDWDEGWNEIDSWKDDW